MKGRTTVQGFRIELSRALGDATARVAPGFVTRRLMIALHFVNGMVKRGEETVRPDVVDLVEEALDRYRAWNDAARHASFLN